MLTEKQVLSAFMAIGKPHAYVLCKNNTEKDLWDFRLNNDDRVSVFVRGNFRFKESPEGFLYWKEIVKQLAELEESNGYDF